MENFPLYLSNMRILICRIYLSNVCLIIFIYVELLCITRILCSGQTFLFSSIYHVTNVRGIFLEEFVN